MKLPLLFFIAFVLVISCNRDKKLERTLVFAGENRSELQKVIDHYSYHPADSLKLKAAKFLIRNMPGHYSVDTSSLKYYRSIIDTTAAMSDQGERFVDIRQMANKMLDSIRRNHPIRDLYSNVKRDIAHIKSEYLIKNIDSAFELQKNNPYSDSINIADFWDYVLPYRIGDRYTLENWRDFFPNSYKSGQSSKSIKQYCNSLLEPFKNKKFGWKFASGFPYLKSIDILNANYIQCPERCWLNCMLLRNSGMAVAIDFVPASRLHAYGHEWNTLLASKSIYPFEPFWEENIWNLGEYYKRNKRHPKFGKILFPKVYRKTFSEQPNLLLQYSLKNKQAIPPLFNNVFYKDVTDEYFHTYDIDIGVDNKYRELEFAYVCVMKGFRGFKEVAYGRVKHGKLELKSMGTSCVYFPMQYIYNQFVPIGQPVLLRDGGDQTILNPKMNHRDSIALSFYGESAPEVHPGMIRDLFRELKISGYNNISNKKVDFSHVGENFSSGVHRFVNNEDEKIKSVEIILPKHTLINEITFISKDGGEIEKDQLQIEHSYELPRADVLNMFDNNTDTRFMFIFNEKPISSDKNRKIKCGFSKSLSIREIKINYFLRSNLAKEREYELFFWNYGWKSLGKKITDEFRTVTFHSVPTNALFKLSDCDSEYGGCSRHFTYENEKQVWW